MSPLDQLLIQLGIGTPTGASMELGPRPVYATIEPPYGDVGSYGPPTGAGMDPNYGDVGSYGPPTGAYNPGQYETPPLQAGRGRSILDNRPNYGDVGSYGPPTGAPDSRYRAVPPGPEGMPPDAGSDWTPAGKSWVERVMGPVLDVFHGRNPKFQSPEDFVRFLHGQNPRVDYGDVGSIHGPNWMPPGPEGMPPDAGPALLDSLGAPRDVPVAPVDRGASLASLSAPAPMPAGPSSGNPTSLSFSPPIPQSDGGVRPFSSAPASREGAEPSRRGLDPFMLGLAMAAANQPGRSVIGALGQGGLMATKLANDERRLDVADKREDRQLQQGDRKLTLEERRIVQDAEKFYYEREARKEQQGLDRESREKIARDQLDLRSLIIQSNQGNRDAINELHRKMAQDRVDHNAGEHYRRTVEKLSPSGLIPLTPEQRNQLDDEIVRYYPGSTHAQEIMDRRRAMQSAPGGLPRPTNKAEYDKLAPGTRYIDRNGIERTKQ